MWPSSSRGDGSAGTTPCGVMTQTRQATRLEGTREQIPGNDDRTGFRMLRVAERRVLSDRNRSAVRM
jgi:hypothetical protein